MKRYRKIHKLIALVNSYHSLEGSDHVFKEDVQKAMDYCENEACKLAGVDNMHALPNTIEELINNWGN